MNFAGDSYSNVKQNYPWIYPDFCLIYMDEKGYILSNFTLIQFVSLFYFMFFCFSYRWRKEMGTHHCFSFMKRFVTTWLTFQIEYLWRVFIIFKVTKEIPSKSHSFTDFSENHKKYWRIVHYNPWLSHEWVVLKKMHDLVLLCYIEYKLVVAKLSFWL